MPLPDPGQPWPPQLTAEDVNAQHLAAMGLAGVPLGQPVREKDSREYLNYPKGRCTSYHPEDDSMRCVLQSGHDQRYHVRGRVSWRDETKEPHMDRACDDAKTKVPHDPHEYTVGEVTQECSGYPGNRILTKEERDERLARLRPPTDVTGPCGTVEPHAGHGYAVGSVSYRCDGVAQPTKQRPGDQVLPTPGQQCVQDLVIAEMEESKRVGLERYGSTLQTFNGRRSIQDVAEEIRDLHVYIKQIEAESDADRDTLIDVVAKALHPESDGEDVATAEVAVDAIMGWVVGKRQDSGSFEDQQQIYDFLDEAWPPNGGRAQILECLTHALGDFLDVPPPQK